MALESFYGGKPGFSPVIKASFKYINNEDPAYQTALNNNDNNTAALKEYTMDECFKDINYTDVWYGELCIIDTENKMNPNNGKLYRRTLKKAPDDARWTQAGNTTYAEYIGQIVGPSGGVPNLDLGSLDAERKKAVGTEKTYDTDGNLPLDTSGWDYSYRDAESGQMTNANPQGDISKIKVLDAGGINDQNIEMVPGKDGSTYHDTIKYTWCNVRRTLDNSNEDAWIYLGFQIPYTVFDIASTEKNYTYAGSVLTQTQIGSDNKKHPFYQNLHFYIPRGARGIGPEEIFCINPQDQFSRNLPAGANLYTYDAISYDQEQDKYIVDQNKKKIVSALDSYWVGKWCIYNPKINFTNTVNTDVIYVYLGSYKDVRKIELSNTGALTFTYSDSKTFTPDKKITWITSAIVDTNNASDNYGQFNITFNNDQISSINENLHLIKNVTYTDSTGKIKFDYSGNLSKTAGNIEYIKSLNINTDRTDDTNYGKVTGIKNITSSAPVSIATLPLIKDTTYNAATGEITFKYSNNINITPTGIISYISKMRIQDDGTLQYQLNNETGNTWHNITNTGTTSGTSLKIKDIKSTSISDDGHLWITYRDNTTVDLGLVKGNAIAGIVYTLENSNTADKSFESETVALNNLQNKTYEASDSTTIGGNNDGRIKVDNSDVTGGLVSAKIKQSGNSNEYYSVIFYYDTVTKTWVNAGSIGGLDGSGGNSNIYIIGPKDSYVVADTNTIVANNGITYPADDANNPEIYFIDSRKLIAATTGGVPSPDGLSNIQEIITMPPYADPPSTI